MKLGLTFSSVEVTFRRVLQALANQLTIEDNFRARIFDVTTPGVANTAFTVEHAMDKIPTAYFWNTDKGFIYDHDRANWTNTEMFLKCSEASAQIRLVVF